MKYYLVTLSGAPEKAAEESAPDMEQSFAGSMTVSLASAASSEHRDEIKQFPCILGRGDEVNIRVKNGNVSRRHCRLTKEDDRFFIEDLGSTNGTELRGKGISSKTDLRDGDLITVGGVLLRFEIKE